MAMSDVITITTGERPWRPTDDSELVAVLHRFTIPLVGVIKQDGNHFLFWCIVGHAAEENAWGYACVEEGSWTNLAEASDKEFDERLRELVGRRATKFAMANDERGVGASVELDPPASFDDVFVQGMGKLRDKIIETQAEFQALREQAHRMRLPELLPSSVDPAALSEMLSNR